MKGKLRREDCQYSNVKEGTAHDAGIRKATHVLHELLASGANLLGEGSREHHDLLVVRGGAEDVLNIPAHVDLLEDLVTLVNDKVLDTRNLERLVTNKGVHTARSTDNDVRALGLVLEHGLVLGDGCTTVDDTGADIGHVLGKTGVLVADLVGELTSVAEDDDGNLAVDGLDLLKGSKDEDGSLTHTGLGLTHDVHAEDRLGDTFLLDCGV